MATSKKRADAQIDFADFATGNIARGTSSKSLHELVNNNACTIAEAMAYAKFMVAKSDPSSKGFIARWTKIGADLAKGHMQESGVYFAKAKPKAKAKVVTGDTYLSGHKSSKQIELMKLIDIYSYLRHHAPYRRVVLGRL